MYKYVQILAHYCIISYNRYVREINKKEKIMTKELEQAIKIVKEMQESNMSNFGIVTFLEMQGFPVETGFWLIDKANGVK